MGYLGATLTQVFTHACGADMSLRDVTTAWDGKRGWQVRMTSRTGSARRILGILKKVIWVKTGHRTRRVDLRLLAEALGWCRTRWVGGRWKIQDRKNVYLSPYAEEPLNSKVIKSFVPELKSRYVFFEFRDSYVLCMHIWISYVHFTHSRIWLCNNLSCHTKIERIKKNKKRQCKNYFSS